MKETEKKSGLLVNGSIRSVGVTFYTRNGMTVVRSSHTKQPRRNTREQFVARQRMRHTTSLWQMFKSSNPMFQNGKSSYARFASLANRLPAVFLPGRGSLNGVSLLLPGIPISDGTLPAVDERLGVVDGQAALLTDLRTEEMMQGDMLILYTVQQNIEANETPRVRFDSREVVVTECLVVDGCLALVGDEYSDTMKGWALVRVNDGRCSSQTVVTNCTYYEQYTTEQALMATAKAYGGLTRER